MGAARLTPFVANMLAHWLAGWHVVVAAPLLPLYPFKYRDPISGTWIKSRYKARIQDIQARYAEWMIDGEPEIRGMNPSVGFKPYSRLNDGAVTAGDANVEIIEPPRLSELDSLSAFLVAVFLRLYGTYCTRRSRFSAMDGAACLLTEVRRSRVQ